VLLFLCHHVVLPLAGCQHFCLRIRIMKEQQPGAWNEHTPSDAARLRGWPKGPLTPGYGPRALTDIVKLR
jgi:hypothetical protein